MKLAMIRRIAHHTSGEAKPLTPVQDHALSVFATSVAPRFKRNSDTSTHATLRASCSQGLRKPEGRFCIRFSMVRSNPRNQFRIEDVLVGYVTPCAPRRRTSRPTSAGALELIDVRKPL